MAKHETALKKVQSAAAAALQKAGGPMKKQKVCSLGFFPCDMVEPKPGFLGVRADISALEADSGGRRLGLL